MIPIPDREQVVSISVDPTYDVGYLCLHPKRKIVGVARRSIRLQGDGLDLIVDLDDDGRVYGIGFLAGATVQLAEWRP